MACRKVLVGLAVYVLSGQFVSTSAFSQEQDQQTLAIYSMYLPTEEIRLVTSAPEPELFYCGAANWSPDGTQILIDATPGYGAWNRTQLFAVEFEAGEVGDMISLGPGNCPSWSPDGKQIVFLLNPGAVPDAPPGIWLMNADGSDRRRLSAGSRPIWAPRGDRILNCSFSSPARLSLMDAVLENERALVLGGYDIFPVPSWAGDDARLIAVIRDQDSRKVSIALIDVTDVKNLFILSTLWERTSGAVEPSSPVYVPESGKCFFVGRGEEQRLYELEAGDTEPRMLELDGVATRFAALSVSPDGDYLLFCSDLKLESPDE